MKLFVENVSKYGSVLSMACAVMKNAAKELQNAERQTCTAKRPM